MTICHTQSRSGRIHVRTHPQRRLHLVDIENLSGGPLPSAELVRECRRRYIEIAQPGGSDLVVVACSHSAAAHVMFEWPGARCVIRSGVDGADLALLGAWADLRSTLAGFSEVFIASGDHIFAPLAAWMAGVGIPVVVVSRPDSLSSSLRFAAGRLFSFAAEDEGPVEILPKWRTSQPRRADSRVLAGFGG